MGNIYIVKTYKYDKPSVCENDIRLLITKKMRKALQEDENFKNEVTKAIDKYFEISSNRKVIKKSIFKTSKGNITLRKKEKALVVRFENEEGLKQLLNKVI